jgi:hypothetical protein
VGIVQESKEIRGEMQKLAAAEFQLPNRKTAA